MLKAVRNRGNMPEEAKWYRVIILWRVLTYIGMSPSMSPKKVMCIKDRRFILPQRVKLPKTLSNKQLVTDVSNFQACFVDFMLSIDLSS